MQSSKIAVLVHKIIPKYLFEMTCVQIQACFATGQLLRLLHSAGSQPTCSSTSAAARPWLVVEFVVSFLHHSTNTVINWIKLWTAGWPHVRSNEFRSHNKAAPLFDMHNELCIVLLKDVNFIGDVSAG